MKRYSGEPKRLYDFMTDFAVHCPQCNAMAEVSVPYFLQFKEAVLLCKSCHFSEKIASRTHYRPVGKAKCPDCLESLDLNSIKPLKKIPEYINITCESCHSVNKINENWEPEIVKYQTSGIVDPAFGLPLWYQDEIRGNIFWAYNRVHLLEIKAYVEAKLRERTTDRFKMTMVERLPDFIKSSKNRDLILKCIDKMLSKNSKLYKFFIV